MVQPGQPIPRDADLIILPGSQGHAQPISRPCASNGWDIDILAHHRAGGAVLGICGGYQMLGRTIADPDGIEGAPGTSAGLGLLDVETVLDAGQAIARRRRRPRRAPACRFPAITCIWASPRGPMRSHPFARIGNAPEGAISADGRVTGTYLHGLFCRRRLPPRFLAAWAAPPGDRLRGRHRRHARCAGRASRNPSRSRRAAWPLARPILKRLIHVPSHRPARPASSNAGSAIPAQVLTVIGHPVIWFGKLIGFLETRLNKPEKHPRERREAGIVTLLAVLLAALLVVRCWCCRSSAPFAPAAGCSKSSSRRLSSPRRNSAAPSTPSPRLCASRSKLAARPSAISSAAIRRRSTKPASPAPPSRPWPKAPRMASSRRWFWLVLLGLPGIALYKAINTADSMIGHRQRALSRLWLGGGQAR